MEIKLSNGKIMIIPDIIVDPEKAWGLLLATKIRLSDYQKQKTSEENEPPKIRIENLFELQFAFASWTRCVFAHREEEDRREGFPGHEKHEKPR